MVQTYLKTTAVKLICFEVLKGRRKLGLTQSELARKSGVSRTEISNIEACRRTPSIKTLISLYDAFGINLVAVLQNL